jgi:hypothetical protein
MHECIFPINKLETVVVNSYSRSVCVCLSISLKALKALEVSGCGRSTPSSLRKSYCFYSYSKSYFSFIYINFWSLRANPLY